MARRVDWAGVQPRRQGVIAHLSACFRDHRQRGRGRRESPEMRLRPFASVILVATLGSCVGAPGPRVAVVAPTQFTLARPGSAWPAASARCEIPKEAQADPCGAPIDIFAARAGTAPVARLERRASSEVVWSELPLLGDAPVARVSVRGEGIRIGGWASLAGQAFEVRERFEIFPDLVWVPPGARLAVLGTYGDRLAVAITTPFKAPDLIETTAACSVLGAPRATTRAAAGPPYALATGAKIALRATPTGPVVFTFEPRGPKPWVWIDRREGHVHIAGGQPPWQSALSDTSLLFDGWVHLDEVRRVEAMDGDNERGCEPQDLLDVCPDDRTLRDVPLFVGAAPGGAPIGIVERGAAIELGDHRDGFVAVATRNHVVVPPAGQRFWIRDADVDRGCAVRDDDDGCPRCATPTPGSTAPAAR
jgi:hypothetical protein